MTAWLTNPNAPAWLQAFTAIVALVLSLLAIVTPAWTARKRNRAERQSILAAIYPEVEMMEREVVQIKSRLDHLLNLPKHVVGSMVAAEIGVAVYLPDFPMLERYVKKLFVLGEPAGPLCVGLFRYTIYYKSAAINIPASIGSMDADQWREALADIYVHLNRLEKEAKRCETELRRTHNISAYLIR
jgi:hypothetical protein